MNLETPDIQDKIEAYILSKLSPEDRLSFEKIIADNPDLREEIVLQQSIHSLFNDTVYTPTTSTTYAAIKDDLNSPKYQDYSQHLKTIQKTYNKSGTSNKSFIWYFSGIAASLLLGLFLMFNNGTIDQQYDTYADWDDLPSYVEKGKEITPIQEIEGIYNKEGYTEIITLLKNQLLQEMSDEKIIFLGASYFNEGKHQKALLAFDHLSERTSLNSSIGDWYKLLIYMSMSDEEQTNRMLRIITQDKNNYHFEEASAIKKELSKNK